MEDPDDRQINRATQPTKAFKEEEENTLEKQKEGKIQTVEPGKVKRPSRTPEINRGQQNAAWVMDLSKEDFLRLLGVMEGEVQVRGSPLTLCCCLLATVTSNISCVPNGALPP